MQDGRIERLQVLHELIYRQHHYGYLDEYKELITELEAAGCQYEHGYGYYLHLPNGKTVVVDDYNETE